MTDFFDMLEADLVAAGRQRGPGPSRSHRLTVAVAILVTVLAGAGAAAAAYYVLRVSPIAPFSASDSIPDQTVAPGSSAVLALRAADPDRGVPSWAMRVAKSETGLTCSTVGQVQDRRFGLVGLDDRFRPLPDANADACGEPDVNGLAVLGSRVFAGRNDAGARTVVYGLAGPKLTRVTLRVRGRKPYTLRPTTDGAFMRALRGYPEDLQPVVSLKWRTGRSRRLAFGQSPFIVPDPYGGRAYRLEASAFGSDPDHPRAASTIGCVQFTTARTDRSDRGVTSPPACGSEPTSRTRYRNVLYFTTRRLAGDSPSRQTMSSGDWNGHPTRVALWGNARSARRITASLPDGRTRSAIPTLNGAFLVVLPSDADPASVRVTALGRDGSRKTYGPTHATVRSPFQP